MFPGQTQMSNKHQTSPQTEMRLGSSVSKGTTGNGTSPQKQPSAFNQYMQQQQLLEAINLGTQVYNQQNPGSFLENQNPILTGSSLMYLPNLPNNTSLATGAAPYPSPRATSIDPLLRTSLEEQDSNPFPNLNIQQKIAKKNRDKERKLLAGGPTLAKQATGQGETSQAKFLPYENHRLFNAQKSAKILQTIEENKQKKASFVIMGQHAKNAGP